MDRQIGLVEHHNGLTRELSNLERNLNNLTQEVRNTNNEIVTATRNGNQAEARRLSDRVNDLYRQINCIEGEIRDKQRVLAIINR